MTLRYLWFQRASKAPAHLFSKYQRLWNMPTFIKPILLLAARETRFTCSIEPWRCMDMAREKRGVEQT